MKKVHDLPSEIRIGGFEFFPIPEAFIQNCAFCNKKLYEIICSYNATKITLDTKNFILCMEMADSKIPLGKLEKATLALRQALEKFCPRDYKSFIANTNESLHWDI